MKKQQAYHSYMLRCWLESDAEAKMHTWRFSLESVQDKQRYGFADLQALLTFLHQITSSEKNADTDHMPILIKKEQLQ